MFSNVIILFARSFNSTHTSDGSSLMQNAFMQIQKNFQVF